MKRIFVCINIMFLLWGIVGKNVAAQPKGEKYSLAVLNFEMEGNSLFYSDVRFITGEFIRELIKANLFHTMEHSNVERGLVEKNHDPDAGCNEMDCALNAAGALGVQLIMFGSLIEENNKFNLEVKMVHVLSKKIVKVKKEKYPNDLSQVYHGLPMFVSEFLGITLLKPVVPVQPASNPQTDETPIKDTPDEYITEHKIPLDDFDEPKVIDESSYDELNYVEEDTTEKIDTGATYYDYPEDEKIDTGAIYYPEENKLKKYLYWGLGAVAIGSFSASIILLSGGSPGDGGSSNNLPDPPAFP